MAKFIPDESTMYYAIKTHNDTLEIACGQCKGFRIVYKIKGVYILDKNLNDKYQEKYPDREEKDLRGR